MSAKLAATIVSRYLELFPEEKAGLGMFLNQIEAGDALNDRKTLPGHMTGSAIVLSPDRSQILLINHRFLQKWLQPGGHWERTESDPLEAAKREAIEETGTTLGEYLALDASRPLVPLDIQVQSIPDRPERAEPAHLHYDFRYVFVAVNTSLAVTEQQIIEAAWYDFDALECKHIRPIIDKLRSRGIIEAKGLARP